MSTPAEPVYRTEALIAEDIDAYLEQHQHKTMLRFITCGSVDDGKSTLIGRLLYDSKLIFEDQLASLEADSKRVGTQGEAIDFALLVDGLAAEREQGITIDVAYRFFATELRKFIVADTPGHEQYTRNMVTGASTAQLAVILIDARKGVLTQTRRHSYLAKLVGIRHILLAINKMDLVDYKRSVFDAIVADYRAFAEQIGIEDFVAVPVSGLMGDNIIALSEATPWYQGPDPAASPGDGRDRRAGPGGAAVPHAGAMGQSAKPGFPRLLRPDRQRHGAPRRCRSRSSPARRARPSRASSPWMVISRPRTPGNRSR